MKAHSLSSRVCTSEDVASIPGTECDDDSRTKMQDNLNLGIDLQDRTYGAGIIFVHLMHLFLCSSCRSYSSRSSSKTGPSNAIEQVGSLIQEGSTYCPTQDGATQDKACGPLVSYSLPPFKRPNAKASQTKSTMPSSRNQKKEFPCSIVYKRIAGKASTYKCASESWGSKSPLFLPCSEIKVTGSVIEDSDITNMNKITRSSTKHISTEKIWDLGQKLGVTFNGDEREIIQ
ncbi:hypothetical protein Ancab_025451 [Ancistrocladus abbreviatus]